MFECNCAGLVAGNSFVRVDVALRIFENVVDELGRVGFKVFEVVSELLEAAVGFLEAVLVINVFFVALVEKACLALNECENTLRKEVEPLLFELLNA